LTTAKFIGREHELKKLNVYTKKKTASLLVIKGRRRVGKSRLIVELAKRNKIKLLHFEGLFPEEGVAAKHHQFNP
jgi:uncharacterized protein